MKNLGATSWDGISEQIAAIARAAGTDTIIGQGQAILDAEEAARKEQAAYLDTLTTSQIDALVALQNTATGTYSPWGNYNAPLVIPEEFKQAVADENAFNAQQPVSVATPGRNKFLIALGVTIAAGGILLVVVNKIRKKKLATRNS